MYIYINISSQHRLRHYLRPFQHRNLPSRKVSVRVPVIRSRITTIRWWLLYLLWMLPLILRWTEFPSVIFSIIIIIISIIIRFKLFDNVTSTHTMMTFVAAMDLWMLPLILRLADFPSVRGFFCRRRVRR